MNSDLVVAQREDLVASHIGETAEKTREVLNKASGGTLLIDEAYRLVPEEPSKDFGPEALETIMSVIEGTPQTTTMRPAVIFAGYPENMDRVVNNNPGMARRITHSFTFPDYSVQELVDILRVMAKKDGFQVSPSNRELEMLIASSFTADKLAKYNAGFSSQMLCFAREAADARLAEFIIAEEEMEFGNSFLTTLVIDDFKEALKNICL